MGGGGGRTPTVDRSADRANWTQTQNAARDSQAAAFNQRVNEFNTGLQNFISGSTALRGRAGSLGILDDEQFGGLENEINDKRSRLTAYDFTDTAPDFPTSVNSGISDSFSSGVVTLNVPSLSRPNTSARNAAFAELDAAANALRTMRDQRRAEEARVRQTVDEKRGLLSGLNSQVGNLSLRDFASQRNNLRGSTAQLRSRIDGFSSPILSEFMGTDLTGLRSGLDSIEGQLAELTNREANERNRITSFSQGLLGRASDAAARAGRMTIADEAGLNELQAAIDAMRTDATGFSSELDFNFQPALSQIDSANNRLTTLRGQRDAELQRVRNAQQQANREVEALNQGLQTANIFNLGDISGLEGRLAALRTELGNFSTPLTADFSSPLTRADQIAAGLSGLRNDRQTALTNLVNEARGQMNLNDIPLENEQAINDRRSRLNTLQSQLSQFTGNDLNDERGVFNEAMTALDNRMRQLSDRRSAIETRARQLQAAIANGTFTNLSDLDPRQAEMAQLRAEQELFQATQALDELDAIASTLTQQRQRIERDIASRSQSQQSEREAMMRQLGLTLNGPSVGPNTQLSAEEIAALLSGTPRRREELQPGTQVTPAGSFSALLAA